MNSKIQIITPSYTKFENILPDELIESEITDELAKTKNEINMIVDVDLRNIKNLAIILENG
jgi:hypothetical protein